MKVLMLFSVLVVSALAEFKYKSCGGDDSYVTVNKLQVSPDPLVFPGQVSYSVDFELKKAVKDVSMTVKIVKNSFLLDVTLPCVQQIGSCSYRQMCSFVEDMNRENWGGIGKKIAAQILAKAPADRPDLCQTGLKPVRLSQSGSLAIPELPSILSFIATGDYTIEIEFKDNTANKVIHCLEVEAELTKGDSGSFWGKRRLRNLD